MSTHSYKKFEDVESGAFPDKMTVYQDCVTAFNASPVQAKRCRLLLSRLLRLIYSGETFPANEATSLFFSISKLFQHKDSSLRQLVYLAIKELCAVSNDVLMVTSSIMKDIQNGELIYKPNAIRTLVRVLDGSTVHATERLMKNCVVDKNPSVTTATLVSSYHLLPVAKDVVRRWTNETQEAIFASKTFPSSQFLTHDFYGSNRLPSSTFMYQYHALGLLYHLRNHDKMALMKMISSLGSSGSSQLKNNLAIVQLIRFIGKILDEDKSATSALFSVIAGWLRHKSDMVELEAAKVILSLSHLSSEQHGQAISTLQVLLSVPRTVTRFGAVRILNRIAMKAPEKITLCNVELESMISDPNRSISTYAITTLLKTGNSENVDRLIKSIAQFMSDISDEFKIVVVDAVRALCLKFPNKHSSMLEFLNTSLRDEGGFAFKNAIVEAIFDLIKFVPESRDVALEHLCEFIEDCEFTELAVRILHVLGNEGPKTNTPTLYIRHIYNRVVLENSIVRSSAVIALSKFAAIGDSKLTENIRILLSRCLSDVDDEVRDRAAISIKLLDKDTKLLVPNGNSTISLSALEHQLSLYLNTDDKSTFDIPFDISGVPAISEEESRAIEYTRKAATLDEQQHNNGQKKESSAVAEEKESEATSPSLLNQKYSQELSAIPEIATHGELLHSSVPVPLTERETEFVVTAIKHVFESHLVLQFNIDNTLTDMAICGVNVICNADEAESFQEEFSIPLDTLLPNSSGCVYVSWNRDAEIELASFETRLAFVSKEADPSTGEIADPDDEGFQDEYEMESLSLAPGDFIVPSFVGSFTHAWDEMPNEQVSVYTLKDADDLSAVTASLITSLSMMPMEGSDVVSDASNAHQLKLYGKSCEKDNGRVAAMIKMVYNSEKGVMLKATVRADDAALSEVVANGIA